MVREKEAFLRSLIKFFDTTIILFSFFLSYFVSFYLREFFGKGDMAFAISADLSGFLFFAEKNILLWVSYIPAWIIVLGSMGAYHDIRTKSIPSQAFAVVKTAFITTFILGAVIFLFKMTLTSRLFVGTYTAITIVMLIIGKMFMYNLLSLLHEKGYNEINILLVGTGKRARQFIRSVNKHSNWGLRIVGLVDDDHGMFGKEIEGYRVLGRIQDIPFILHRKVIDRVIFVVPRLWLNRIDEAILACEREGISTSISMDLYNLRIAKVRQTDFSGFPLLEFETFSAQEWELFIKRTFDIVFSIFLLTVLSPIMLIIALIIKLTSKGPIMFKQNRSGLNGRQFTLYKFRSMIVGAEVKKRELMRANEMDGPVFKIKHDPRITTIGRIIRKTSMDELPQLFNVLKGDMSIVGPRPPLPVEVELYQLWQRRRLSLKPGLTCIWQVSGRNNIKFERWMEMDLEYIDNWSLWLDLKILFRTFFVVLTGYGAS
ncbi:MAG: sugar transferase [Deferribacteres bacterium]|nr:sugar transferase [candidate division KSB1 bacterium]MCB9503348.1 sugar transferase [Deferribacteres bacterium]